MITAPCKNEVQLFAIVTVRTNIDSCKKLLNTAGLDFEPCCTKTCDMFGVDSESSRTVVPIRLCQIYCAANMARLGGRLAILCPGDSILILGAPFWIK